MDIEKLKEQARQALSQYDFFVEIIREEPTWTFSKTKNFLRLQKRIAYLSREDEQTREMTWTACFSKDTGELEWCEDDL